MPVFDHGAPDHLRTTGVAVAGDPQRLIGTTIGPYRVVAHLGSGGMGDVFAAVDDRLRRQVAVKILGPRLAPQRHFRNQLLKEARAVAQLSHPNIAQVYDVLEHDGRAAIVMERLHGQSLSQRLAAGALPVRDVVSYGQQIAGALEHAHERGLLHCDLKPANIFVTTEGAVKVLDFGLARSVSQAMPGSSGLLGPPTALVLGRAGTPPYMSPEQMRGEALDERSDIYALGVVLHEMAAGGPPAPALVPLVGNGTTQTAVMTRPDPALPRGLRSLIQRATAFDVEERPRTAAEVGAALAALRSFRRVPASVVASAAVICLAIGVGYWRGNAAVPVFTERGTALVSDFAGGADPALNRTAREGFTIALRQSRFLNVAGGDRIADALQRMQRPAAGGLDQPTALELGRREGIPLLLAGSVASSGRTTQLTVQGMDTSSGEVVFVATRAFSRPEDLFAALDGLAVEIRRDLGESSFQISRTSAPLARVTTQSFEALRQYSTAVDARARGRVDLVRVPLESAITIDPHFAMAHLKLGDYLLAIEGDVARAIEYFKRAYDLRDRVTERERLFIEASYFSAAEEYDAARDRMRVLAQLYPDDADIRFELALAEYSLENLEAGISELRATIRLDPRSARAHGNLVLMLAKDDRPGEALDAARRAKAEGVDTPDLHRGSGLARLAEGDVTGAEGEFTAMKAGGDNYAERAQLELARAAVYQGRLDRALALADEGISLSRASGNKTLELYTRELRGKILLAAGRRQAAGVEAQAVLDTPDEALGAEDLRRAGTLFANLGLRSGARAALSRLERLRAAHRDSYVEFCVQHLTGAIALREGHPDLAYRAFEAASLAWPWYESWQGMASAREAQGDWRGALPERQRVLTVKGRMLRDGFPLDWSQSHLAIARTYASLGRCEDARAAASEVRRVLTPGAAAAIPALADLDRVEACAGVRR